MTSPGPHVEQLVVGSLLTNCYIAWERGSKRCAVIDAGDEDRLILKKVEGLGLEIELILATHGHFDHVGGVAGLKKAAGAEFLAHEGDLSFIEESARTAREWGFSVDQPPMPDRFLKDGEKICMGSLELKVIHTPGHSPGSVSFLCGSALFSGDTLFLGSIGSTEFRDGSLADITRSIRTRLYALPDGTRVYTGHGPETTIGLEKRTNPFVRP